ncbi:MAG: hypothetical protein V1829_00090 [bacterium]
MSKKSIIYISVLFITASIVVGSFVYYNGLKEVQAGVGSNTSGFAWSENIGWISFNSTNCDSNGDGLTDTGNYSNCPVGASISSYGVHIDIVSGDLSGFAWSENIGWIGFNRSDTNNPPYAPFNGGSGAIAKYNSETNAITGWMRVLANGGGWDGWIEFFNAYIDSNGEWHGWAWSNMVVGWVSLNSVEGGGADYKVISDGLINQAPIVSNLVVSTGNYCSNPSHYFSWVYSDPDDDNESRVQFQVDNNSDFSSREIDRDFSGLSNPSPAPNSQVATVAVSPSSGQITYNTTYYWRVNVWDSRGGASGWVEGSSFITRPHRYPVVGFSWSPDEPSDEEPTYFTDESVCYNISNSPVVCSDWYWTFPGGDPADTRLRNPMVQFTSDGDKDIILQATNADGNSCSLTKTIGIQIPLPDWKEILPWNW